MVYECPIGALASRRGCHFVEGGQPFYVHGFNAYFLMAISVDLPSRSKSVELLEEAAASGFNVGRTWAFNDGGYQALQISPGVYDENVFQALDFVLNQARRSGLYLILTLVNNWGDYGGKAKYVEWARMASSDIKSEDDFFSDPTAKGFYRNHIKTVLTRVNSITGIRYKDDPTIFAWELINEPQCSKDPSGEMLQAWIEEMAAYLKSIDCNHLLGLGSEGFYGPSNPGRVMENPNDYALQVGTDFLRNHNVEAIDFAGAHGYPDSWLGPGEKVAQQIVFIENWLSAHIADCTSILKKPFLFGEFGVSSKSTSFKPEQRVSLLSSIYTVLYISALGKGAAAGGLLWQLFPKGMENFNDGYQLVLSEDEAVAQLVKRHAERLADLTGSAYGKPKGGICPTIRFKCW
ncbi:hypothetical protein GOP47_0018127 [Adiantum capillus-veneris]|uniref:mannan endo-1,4-beta-mannosidase n=1 Tax=Adiantum capillus-veneris TaxID=13818 RepID=A0A9D4ZAC1_ADICA|nr:hypothetical protein GOP47_0018127 [Adiantum capillus-veneris]